MYEYNLYNLLHIKIDKKLPLFAISNIKKSFSCFNDISSNITFKETLVIGKLTPEVEKSLTNNSYIIDCFQLLDSDRFFERCQYKFSKWKYLFYFKKATKEWHLAVKGDLFSSFAWPYRTLSNIIKLLLGIHGCYFLHAASFFYKGNAILLIAPSGTGKTLTALHWLCDRKQIYSDDTSVYYNGNILPNTLHISFWEHRYKNAVGILPANMPIFSKMDKFVSYIFRFLNVISRGYVGLGMTIGLKEYFSNPIAPISSPGFILSLSKGDKFAINHAANKEVLCNKLIGDFIFQSLPIIRWMDIMSLTGSNFLPCKDIIEGYSTFIKNLINNTPVCSITVPESYSVEVYNKIKYVIENEKINI